MKKYISELIGTMVLVLIGCGSAVFAGAAQPFEPVGTLGVAFAFGLAVLTMVYTIGKVSDCHINPAITFAMMLSHKMSGIEAIKYMVFQFLGALLGSAILYLIAYDSGSVTTLTGANGYENVLPAFVAEVVFTCIFVLVVLGSTSRGAYNKFAGIAIGLALVMIHIVCIPITGTSVNPARSFGPAILEGGVALSQLWLFIIAPFFGGALAAFIWKEINVEEEG